MKKRVKITERTYSLLSIANELISGRWNNDTRYKTIELAVEDQTPLEDIRCLLIDIAVSLRKISVARAGRK